MRSISLSLLLFSLIALAPGLTSAAEPLGIPRTQYMKGLTDYFIGPRRTGEYEGQQAWLAITIDRTLSLAIVGPLDNPQRLVVLFSYPPKNKMARATNRLIALTILSNVAPSWTDPTVWFDPASKRVRGLTEGDVKYPKTDQEDHSSDGVRFTLSYSRVSREFKLAIRR